MYSTVRIIFWGIIFVICIVQMKQKEKLNKKKVIITSTVILILGLLSQLFPVENLFLSFSTPEKAFNYINDEKVVLVVEGKESAFVIGEEDEFEYVYLAIPKCIGGWKLGKAIDIELKDQLVDKDIVISLYHYNESDEYYVSIVNMSKSLLEISDSCDSKFLTLDENGINNEFVHYFANIIHFDENYWIQINNHEFYFQK